MYERVRSTGRFLIAELMGTNWASRQSGAMKWRCRFWDTQLRWNRRWTSARRRLRGCGTAAGADGAGSGKLFRATQRRVTPAAEGSCVWGRFHGFMRHRAGGLMTKTPSGQHARVYWRDGPSPASYLAKKLDVPQSGKVGTTISVVTRYG